MRKPFQVREAVPHTNGSIGNCTHCGKPATKQALFKIVGAVIIERYCDSCMELVLQNRLVKVTSTGHHTIRLTAG